MTNNLPSWDLTDLFDSVESIEIKELYAAIEDNIQAVLKYKGRIESLHGNDLASLITVYEKLEDQMGRISAYAYLRYSADRSNEEAARFFQNTREKLTDYYSQLMFVSLELNRLTQDNLDKKLNESVNLQRFKPWIDSLRLYKDHMLGDEAEQLYHDKALTSQAAWVRLYDETLADIRFDLNSEMLPIADIMDKLSDKDESVRKEAALAFSAGLKANIKLFTMITNTLSQNLLTSNKWRRYSKVDSSRHLDNQIDAEVVDALKDAVQGSYKDLSHKYYALKAKVFGKSKLQYWDRNAPYPQQPQNKISWDEAKNIVLKAYRNFSPEMADIVQNFFDKNWIDAALRPGKDSGAFSHPTVPSAHPYILMNFQGKNRCVMTLAHELGHGVHQVLSAGQGALMADTPLTLAETASVFGEMLTFQSLLDQTSGMDRTMMLAGKIEDMLNTVVRQIAFYQFELDLHNARQKGELSSADIGKMWRKTQEESLGPIFEFHESYDVVWSYISHFIHVPFYVYAYAFGDCLVNSLYQIYLDRPEGFQEKYLQLLRAGGTIRYDDIVKPFGLDAKDPTFWTKGLSMISRFIDRFEDGL